MSVSMRAKVKCTEINQYGTHTFYPVAKDSPYPPDGSDEDNSYGHFSPSGKFELQIANPAINGKIAVGDKFYVDFTPIP